MLVHLLRVSSRMPKLGIMAETLSPVLSVYMSPWNNGIHKGARDKQTNKTQSMHHIHPPLQKSVIWLMNKINGVLFSESSITS